MKVFFVVYLFGTFSAAVGPWPDQASCDQFRVSEESELTENFKNIDFVKKLQSSLQNGRTEISRADIVYRCEEK